MYPWYEDGNLCKVTKIIDPNASLQPTIESLEWARDQLILWEVKVNQFQYLPELDATLSLVSAVLKDRKCDGKIKSGNSLTNESYDICTFYAMSIVKFCNLLPHYEIKKQGRQVVRAPKRSRKSVRDLGLELDLPSWVLECRHNTCHSSTNSLVLLRQANYFALSWIFKHFWEQMIREEEELKQADKMVTFTEQLEKFFNPIHAKKKKALLEKIKDSINARRGKSFEIIAQFIVKDTLERITEIDLESEGLTTNLTKPHSQLLQLIDCWESIEAFVDALILLFDDEDEKKAKISALWFKEISRSLADENEQDSTRRGLKLSLSIDSEYEDILWLRLLYKVTKRPNKLTPSLVDHLSSLMPSTVSQDRIVMLKNLSTIFLNANEASKNSVPCSIKTIEDLNLNLKNCDQPMEIS